MPIRRTTGNRCSLSSIQANLGLTCHDKKAHGDNDIGSWESSSNNTEKFRRPTRRSHRMCRVARQSGGNRTVSALGSCRSPAMNPQLNSLVAFRTTTNKNCWQLQVRLVFQHNPIREGTTKDTNYTKNVADGFRVFRVFRG